MNNLEYYCEKFSQLNVSSSSKRGNAKYKPILLLSVIDLITRDIIKENKITVSDDLIQTFEKYWNIIGSKSYKGGLHYPFFHLQSEGFWYLEFKPSFNGLQPKTTNKLKEAVEYAHLDIELFNFLLDDATRKELLDTLVTAFFSDNEDTTDNILNIEQTFQDDSERKNLSASNNLDEQPKWSFRKTIIRNTFFRKAVVYVYDYQCAFCGLRVTKNISQSIVDGAHIKPFSQFYDSRVHNGISLCKNHHWAFDRGWFTVDEKYRIIVTKDLEEVSPHAKAIKEFQGEKILLPKIKQYFPDIQALQWHRQNIFQG
jgi:putative restriction endonuclease